jgi:hypothetical protein
LASIVQEAGAAAGVTVLVPTMPGTVPARSFSDGFDLNEEGAKLFTEKFIECLREACRQP